MCGQDSMPTTTKNENQRGKEKEEEEEGEGRKVGEGVLKRK